MAYRHIDNLYKSQDILLFKECYAMEKIHGTSAHVRYKDSEVGFFSGGCKHENFVKLFNSEELLGKFKEKLGEITCVIYGEAYGGKLQGMRDTYGNELRFVAFEVKIGDSWLAVPQAEEFAVSIGFDFVSYKLVATDLVSLDRERDLVSGQAIKNGMGEDKKREGVVLRPPVEVTLNNGERIVAKHKALEFRETKTPREVDEAQLKVLSEAKEIAEEWVTYERLNHILGRSEVEPTIQNTGEIIGLMHEDILREAEGEIAISSTATKEINRKTALMFKAYLNAQIKQV